MRLVTAVIACAAALSAVGVSYVLAAPKPSEAPVKWQLDIDLQDLLPIKVTPPGEDKPRTFWYLRYTVTNRTVDEQTGKPIEQVFVPDFTLYTDTGQIIRAGQKTPAVVFDTIKKIYNQPLLKDVTGMTGKLLYGEDNAKDGVAIWPDFDSKAGSVDIFIGGLSGETVEVALPKPITVTEKDAMGKTKTVTKDTLILSKTLQAHYQVPGEMANRPTPAAILKSKKWVMR